MDRPSGRYGSVLLFMMASVISRRKYAREIAELGLDPPRKPVREDRAYRNADGYLYRANRLPLSAIVGDC